MKRTREVTTGPDQPQPEKRWRMVYCGLEEWSVIYFHKNAWLHALQLLVLVSHASKINQIKIIDLHLTPNTAELLLVDYTQKPLKKMALLLDIILDKETDL